MTSNHQHNTLNGFSWQNPMKKRYYTCSLVDLVIDILTLKMTLSDENGFYDFKRVKVVTYGHYKIKYTPIYRISRLQRGDRL